MQVSMLIKKKRGGEQGWGQPQKDDGWGQPKKDDGWGQPQKDDGWGQPQKDDGWGQPKKDDGWGQPKKDDGWGQPKKDDGWGKPQKDDGWGQPKKDDGWGKPQKDDGWGQPKKDNGWGNQGIGFLNSGSTWGNNAEGSQWVHNQLKANQATIESSEKFNVLKFLEQQITQIEPSPDASKLEQLKKKGQKFLDQRFPANNNSLCGEWGQIEKFANFKWAKLTEKYPKGQIFTGKPQPRDIKQGHLGDCYFLAGLAALAERPDRIFNLFLTHDKNQLNQFKVKMLYKGKWITIDMDEYIPFLENQPAFSKSVNNDFWVILLEKAWAKMYTSFRRIVAGNPLEPLHDLTGAPIKQIVIKDNANKEEQWQYLLMASQKEYSMVCSSNAGSDSNKSQNEVVKGHAYTLLNAVILNYKGQQIRLIQLRNPWGEGQYNGPWSDHDSNWKKVDPKEKERVGYFENKDDGIFFIPFDTFWNEFEQIMIAEIDDNASYLYKSYKDKNKEGCYFKVEIEKEGLYSLQVDKTPQRSFEHKLQKAYNYPDALIELGILNGNSIKRMQGYISNERTTQKKYNMKPGIYIVKVNIDFDPKFEKDFDVNLAVYAEYPCVISLASKQQATIFAGKPVNWTGEEPAINSQVPWNNLAAFGASLNTGFDKPQSAGKQNSGWENKNGGWGDVGSKTQQTQKGGKNLQSQQRNKWEGSGSDGW